MFALNDSVNFMFHQSEGKGRCKVPSACGPRIAVNEFIEIPYLDMLKKRKNLKTAAGFTIAPERGEDDKVSKKDGEIHRKG
jgi:hypothetical protein